MHRVGGQPLVSVLFVAVPITLFFSKNFLLLVNSSFVHVSKVFKRTVNFPNVHGDSTLCFFTKMLFSPLSVFTARDVQ